MTQTIQTVDCLGQPLKVGQEAVFSRNLWRGKDVLVKGVIVSLAPKNVNIQVTSPQPEGIHVYEGWSIVKRAKTTKVFGL